jgi:hypothetical protein
MTAHHQHVKVLIDGVDGERASRIGRRRDDVELRAHLSMEKEGRRVQACERVFMEGVGESRGRWGWGGWLLLRALLEHASGGASMIGTRAVIVWGVGERGGALGVVCTAFAGGLATRLDDVGCVPAAYE